MISSSVMIVFLIVLLIGLCLLEYVLSRLAHPIPGLILPILALLCPCLLLIQSAIAYKIIPTFMAITVTFSVFIAPILLFLAIYFITRRGYRRKKQLDKMNIQDLN